MQNASKPETSILIKPHKTFSGFLCFTCPGSTLWELVCQILYVTSFQFRHIIFGQEKESYSLFYKRFIHSTVPYLPGHSWCEKQIQLSCKPQRKKKWALGTFTAYLATTSTRHLVKQGFSQYNSTSTALHPSYPIHFITIHQHQSRNWKLIPTKN